MVTASIVTYHTDCGELEKCLRTLVRGCVSQVYVIDNAAEAPVEAICRRFGVEYVANRNSGYGAAHNIAIRKALDAGTDYHLVMNSDIEFDPSLPATLAAYMDSRAEVGQVQPSIICPDGRPQYSCRLLPTPFDLILRRFLPGCMFKARRRKYLLAGVDHSREFDCAYQQGSFMFIRAGALKEVGLFDERFFMYPEDIDLSRRIAERYRVRYWPGGTVVHRHRAASYRSWRMLAVHIVNMCRYFNKWGWLFDRGRRDMNAKAGCQPV